MNEQQPKPKTMNYEHWTIPNHEDVQGWTRKQYKRGENNKLNANKIYYKYYSPNGKTFRSVKTAVKHIEEEKLMVNRIIARVECSNVTIEKTPGGGIHIKWIEEKAKKTKLGTIIEEENGNFRNVWENNLPIKWMVNSNPKTTAKSKKRFALYWNNGQNNLKQAKEAGLKWRDALNDYSRNIIAIQEE